MQRSHYNSTAPPTPTIVKYTGSLKFCMGVPVNDWDNSKRVYRTSTRRAVVGYKPPSIAMIQR